MLNRQTNARLLVSPDQDRLSGVVDDLCAANHSLARPRSGDRCRQILPSRATLNETIEALRSVLFPGYFGTTELSDESVKFHVGATLDRVYRSLREQIERARCFVCEQETPANCSRCDAEELDIAAELIARLPEIRRLLATDVQAAYEGDPAAQSIDEIILCYPGILAITNYRIAHELYLLEVPLLPRMVTEQAHSTTGIDIHPGATIGERFFIDHGTGVVIGETSVLGNHVSIYQGVTLGAKSFPLDANGNPIKGTHRHPRVEDDVIIYSGATVLGPLVIGNGAVIGGNVWLTHDVPAGGRITLNQSG